MIFVLTWPLQSAAKQYVLSLKVDIPEGKWPTCVAEEFAKMLLFRLIHRQKQCRSQRLYISARSVQSLAQEQTQYIGQIQLLSSSLCPGSRSSVLSVSSFFAEVQSAKNTLHSLKQLSAKFAVFHSCTLPCYGFVHCLIPESDLSNLVF